MENFSHHASTLGCFPTETPVQRVGGIPSGCHGKDWTLRPGLAGTVMAADWTPWDLTISGQFCLPSERAISLPCTHTAISAWESCPWCPGWTPGVLIFHLVLSDGHWDPLKRRSLVVHIISFAVMENCIEGSVSASWKQGLISPDLLELKWFTVFLNSNPTKIAWEVFNSWLLWESWGFIAWFFYFVHLNFLYSCVPMWTRPKACELLFSFEKSGSLLSDNGRCLFFQF